MTPTPHGTRSRYASGCHCLKCRAANSNYRAEPLVDADAARKHLLMLKHAHVGLRLISEICGVSDSSIAEIRSGVTVRIRARTERAILQVDRQARSNGSLVPAKPTWKLIGELLDEGFTVEELARRLGYESGKLQFNRNLVTAKTELKVERLWKKTMEGS